MYRIILFLLLIALAGVGAAWIADQPGEVVMSWGSWRAHPKLPVFMLLLGIVIVAAMLVWTILLAFWRTAGTDPPRPARTPSGARPACHHPRPARGRPWRFCSGPGACRCRAPPCRRMIRWRCCCMRNRRSSTATATGAQARLSRHGRTRGYEIARLARAVHRGAARRRSGCRGDASRKKRLKLAPASTWASQAVLGFRCARGDWNGALTILDNNLESGLIDKAAWRRQRGVLLDGARAGARDASIATARATP